MSSPFDPPDTDATRRSGETTSFGSEIRDQLLGARPYQIAIVLVMVAFIGLNLLMAIINPCIAAAALLWVWPTWQLYDSVRILSQDAPDEVLALSLSRQALFWRITGWTTLALVVLYVLMFVAMFAVIGTL